MTAIALGYVAGAHGLGGDVRLRLFHAGSGTLREGVSVMLAREGQPEQRLVIERIQQTGDQARVVFRGVRDRDAAEALVGFEVSVDRSILPEPAADEVYLADLVGLTAMEGDRVAGTIEGVLHHPASDCVIVREEGGTREVPLRAPYLVEIDLRERCVRFQHLEDFEKVAS